MKGDRGSVTLWMLGLSLLLLLFGGVAIDFWRALALQRELAAIADSASVAAASGVDEIHYRSTGEVVLDPNRAETLASVTIGLQEVVLVSNEVDTAADGSSVTVRLEAEIDLGLLGFFVDQTEPLLIGASATATPVVVP